MISFDDQSDPQALHPGVPRLFIDRMEHVFNEFDVVAPPGCMGRTLFPDAAISWAIACLVGHPDSSALYHDCVTTGDMMFLATSLACESESKSERVEMVQSLFLRGRDRSLEHNTRYIAGATLEQIQPIDEQDGVSVPIRLAKELAVARERFVVPSRLVAQLTRQCLQIGSLSDPDNENNARVRDLLQVDKPEKLFDELASTLAAMREEASRAA